MTAILDLARQGGPVMIALILLSLVLYERCLNLLFLLNGAKRRMGRDLESIISELKRDLDWIVAKAIQVEASGRCASVRDLATDVRAYLDGLNVLFANSIFGGAAHARPMH